MRVAPAQPQIPASPLPPHSAPRLEITADVEEVFAPACDRWLAPCRRPASDIPGPSDPVYRAPHARSADSELEDVGVRPACISQPCQSDVRSLLDATFSVVRIGTVWIGRSPGASDQQLNSAGRTQCTWSPLGPALVLTC